MPNPDRPAVAIIGLGLIGGSLALRLRERGYDVRAFARDPGTRDAAAAQGITVYDDRNAMLTALPHGSIVVLATPLPAAIAMFTDVAAQTDPSVTITDVVSTKTPLLEAARAAGAAQRYVGAHPMAGTADSGFAAAFPALLDDATWVVTADDETDLDRWLAVSRVVLDTGGRVVPAESEWHDHAVAWISHLPHVLAELLAANVEPQSLLGSLAAGSFRDATRVAATRPELVDAMLMGNRAMVVEAIEGLWDQLEHAGLALKAGSSETLTARGHAHRQAWEASRTSEQRRTTRLDLNADGIRERLLEVGSGGGVVVSADDAALTALVFERGDAG